MAPGKSKPEPYKSIDWFWLDAIVEGEMLVRTGVWIPVFVTVGDTGSFIDIPPPFVVP